MMGTMTIKLSTKDQRAMDATLDTILEAYKSGEVSLLAARGALAHVLTAAAIGNETDVRGWLTPETLSEWKKQARNTKGPRGEKRPADASLASSPASSTHTRKARSTSSCPGTTSPDRPWPRGYAYNPAAVYGD